MKRQRHGFTLLEFIVALLLFGIAMSGLFPLVVMYSRVLESLEQRPKLLDHRNAHVDGNEYRKEHPDEWYQVGEPPYVRTDEQPNSGDWVHKWYLVPASDSASSASDAWARKLGASASVEYKSRTSPPDVLSLTEPTKADITELDAGGPGYINSSDPAWTDYDPAPGAYANNQRQPEAGKVATATWTFTGVVAGWYRVEATGLVSGETTLPAGTYKLSYGTTEGEDVTPPTHLEFETSATWQPLATKYLSAGTVTVQLTTDTSGTAIADGMRIVRCSLQIKSFSVQARGVEPSTPETATASVEIKPAVRVPP